MDLTRRESQVLGWIAQGKSDWQIGKILNISSKTVNYHTENAKRKLGVATRVQAVIGAIRVGAIARVNCELRTCVRCQIEAGQEPSGEIETGCAGEPVEYGRVPDGQPAACVTARPHWSIVCGTESQSQTDAAPCSSPSSRSSKRPRCPSHSRST